MKYKYLVFLVVLTLVTLMLNTNADAYSRKWTVIAYLVGDADDIEIDSMRKLEELKRAGSDSNVAVVAQLDYFQRNNGGTVRYFCEPNYLKKVGDFGDLNSGDPKVLYDFLSWAARTYPAEKYFLIIGGHASGWESGRGPGSLRSGTPNSAIRFYSTRPNMTRVRASMAYDKKSNDCITQREFKAVLDRFSSKDLNGRKIDIVEYDGCHMNNIENAYQIKNYVKYMVASQLSIFVGDFGHEPTINYIKRNLDAPLKKICKEAVNNFVKSATKAAKFAKLDVFNLAYIEKLAKSLSKLACSLLFLDDNQLLNLRDVYSSHEGECIDIRKFAQKAADKNFNSLVRVNALEVLKNYNAAYSGGQQKGETLTSDVGGMSVYFPGTERYSKIIPYYRALDFTKELLWDEFLEAFLIGKKLGEITSSKDLYSLGHEALLNENYREAISYFQMVATHYPDSNEAFEALYYTGEALQHSKDYKRAIEEYKKFMNKYGDTDNGDILFNISTCYFNYEEKDSFLKGQKKKYWQETIFYSKQFIEKYPQNKNVAQALFMMVKAYSSINNAEQSRECYNELKQNFPDSNYCQKAFDVIELKR